MHTHVFAFGLIFGGCSAYWLAEEKPTGHVCPAAKGSVLRKWVVRLVMSHSQETYNL